MNDSKRAGLGPFCSIFKNIKTNLTMKANFKIILIAAFTALSAFSFAQVNSLELNADKEKKFTPYMMYRHQGPDGLADFKKNHKHEYLKELWYYSESFYVKRGYFKQGAELDESIIAIDRFEDSRKETEEAIVILPGFKDVLVLLPANKLIYKP